MHWETARQEPVGLLPRGAEDVVQGVSPQWMMSRRGPP